MAGAVFLADPSALIRRLSGKLSRRIPGTRDQRVGRDRRDDGWRVYFLQTVTGQVGPMADISAGSWEIVLNGIEDLQATVRRRDLRGIEERWYTPWVGGLLLTWTHRGVETPWIAGPIVDHPGQSNDELQISAKGLRELYKHSYIGTDFSVTDRSLGHIMWNLANVPHIKPGGGYNVVDGSPDGGGRGHTRNYPVWNVANNAIDKLMTELSEVENGPDVMFRPQWDTAAGGRFIRWAVVHGTSLAPTIAPTARPIFDTTVAFGGLSDVGISTKSEPILSRVWASGAGEGAGTKIARAEELSLLAYDYPFLEGVISNTDENSQHLLERDALGLLTDRIDAVDQITADVDTFGPLGIGRWMVGDPAEVVLRDWIAIPDGPVGTRIVKAGGDLAGGLTTIDFQTGTWA